MILALESSCDETAVALFDPARGIAGEWIHSQIALHGKHGGVVPDLASREHRDLLRALRARHPERARAAMVRHVSSTGALIAGLAQVRPRL